MYSEPIVVRDGRLSLTQYDGLHKWVRRRLGKPTGCVECNNTKGTRLEWANISGKYLKDITDWESLCASCHRRKDMFGDAHKCKRGHELTEANTYTYPNGRYTECRQCRNLSNDRHAKKIKPSLGGI